MIDVLSVGDAGSKGNAINITTEQRHKGDLEIEAAFACNRL